MTVEEHLNISPLYLMVMLNIQRSLALGLILYVNDVRRS